MGHKNRAFGNVKHPVGNGVEGGRVGNHRIRDAGQVPDKRRNGMAGIEQGMKRVNHLPPVKTKKGNLSQFGGAFHRPGSFNVNDAVHNTKISPRLK